MYLNFSLIAILFTELHVNPVMQGNASQFNSTIVLVMLFVLQWIPVFKENPSEC